ncbi:MAG TPA: hypothetical protein VL261_07495, partial [Nitrospira sp.]|nr:hypothetical protein [Nitrospira sp.]
MLHRWRQAHSTTLHAVKALDVDLKRVVQAKEEVHAGIAHTGYRIDRQRLVSQHSQSDGKRGEDKSPGQKPGYTHIRHHSVKAG